MHVDQQGHLMSSGQLVHENTQFQWWWGSLIAFSLSQNTIKDHLKTLQTDRHTHRRNIGLCFMFYTPSSYTPVTYLLEGHANICAPDINRLLNRIRWSHICSMAKTDRDNLIISTSYRSNTDTHTAHDAVGAQNQKLLPVGTEGVPGHKALLK